jgi:valyl-tRNA synthetase
VPLSKKPHLIICTDRKKVFEKGNVYLSKLAYAGEVSIVSETPENVEGMVSAVTNEAKMYMPLSELVDIEKERERLEKEISRAKAEMDRVSAKLSNAQFISKAPEQVVAAERAKLEKTAALIENLKDTMEKLG